jgi:hypothetical protein
MFATPSPEIFKPHPDPNTLQQADNQKFLEDSFKYIDCHMTITPGTQLHNQ